MPINLYVNKEYQSCVDQLKVVAESNAIPLSTEICKAIREYMNNLNDDKDLVAPDDVWEDFFRKADKDDLREISRVICGLNDRIVRKLCQ